MPDIWSSGYRVAEVATSPAWGSGYRQYNLLGLSTTEIKSATDSLYNQITEAQTLALVILGSDSIQSNVSEAQASFLSSSVSDSINTNVTESVSLALFVSALDTLALSLNEIGGFFQYLSASDSTQLGVTDASGTISCSLSKLDTLAAGLTEGVSIGVLLSALDDIQLTLTELGFFFRDFVSSDQLTINILEGSGEVANTVSSSDLVQVALSESQNSWLFLSVIDSINAALLEVAYFFQDLYSQDDLSANISENSTLVSLIQSLDTLNVQIQSVYSFFKELSYQDNLSVHISETPAIQSFFSSLDTLTTKITESRDLLVSISAADAPQIGVTDVFTDVFVALRLADALNVALFDVLDDANRIAVSLQSLDSVDVLTEEQINALVSYFSTMDSLAVGLTEFRDLFVGLNLTDEISTNINGAFVSPVEVSLVGQENVPVVVEKELIDVGVDVRQDTLRVGVADHILYNYPILSILKRIETYTATIEKIQHISEIVQTSVLSASIEKVKTEATIQPTTILESDIDRKR